MTTSNIITISFLSFLHLVAVGVSAIPQNPNGPIPYGYFPNTSTTAPSYPTSPNTYTPSYPTSYATPVYSTPTYYTPPYISSQTPSYPSQYPPYYSSETPYTPPYISSQTPYYPSQYPTYYSSESPYTPIYNSPQSYPPAYTPYPSSSPQSYPPAYTPYTSYGQSYYPQASYPAGYTPSYAPGETTPVYVPYTPSYTPYSPPYYPQTSYPAGYTPSYAPGETTPVYVAYTPTYTPYSPPYSPPPYSSSPSSYSPPPSNCPGSGIDITSPGNFELWSYAPGICDLDNKPVSSSINYPFNVGPITYYFVDNSKTPPVSSASGGDLFTLTCSSSALAAQAYLRPTHGTPQYFLLFGDPSADPVPQLTLHDNFSLVAGTGAEQGKAFLSYFGEQWLACPGGSNPNTNQTQYSVYWNPGPSGNCVSFRIEVRVAQRACTC